MDRIRTVYLDSAYAEESNNGFQYNVIGGLSVPEGSRVYVDNISFTNTFSNVIGDNNDEVFLKTETNTAMVTPADRTYNWTYAGVPTDRLLSGEYDMKLTAYQVDLTASNWNHSTEGAITFTPVAGVAGEYTFVVNNVTYNLWCYDITQTSFAINSNYPTAGTTGSWCPTNRGARTRTPALRQRSCMPFFRHFYSKLTR